MRKPIVNLEETRGKTVGRRFPNTPVEAYEKLLRSSHAFRRPLPYPRGVFRFKTHEEADEWLWRMKQTVREKDAPDRLFLRQTMENEGIPLDPPPAPPADPLAGVPAWLRTVVRWFARRG